MSDFISIIIPVYNSGEQLYDCVKSIQNSTYKHFEIIIVDDGSNDETAKICDNCSAECDNVKVYHTENKGVSAARNFGINQSKGDYITFVDSDDTVEPSMLMELLTACRLNNSEISIIGYREIYGEDNFKIFTER